MFHYQELTRSYVHVHRPVHESLRAGGDNYLTKPIVVDQCVAMLLHTLSNSRPAKLNSVGPASSCSARPDAPKTRSALTIRENEVMVLLAHRRPVIALLLTTVTAITLVQYNT